MGKKKQHGGKRPGAGRKPGPDGPTVTTAVTVPESLLDRLDALAEAKGWNRSHAVTEAIRGLLTRSKSRS
jgi:hypothetical protein